MHLESITKFNDQSMLALHIPWLDISSWETALTTAYTFVKAPLTIGCTKPVGYAPSWAHKPLSMTQSFFLWKTRVAKQPTHNAWKMLAQNVKGEWRSFWSELAVLRPKEYLKSQEEIRYHGVHLHTHSTNNCTRTQ